ncbi:MAG: VWA domain-containing protein, partial [Hyphomicrobiaceae bacterium]|nr:VWA domain-containing protein [Hyphomicrobiaceae bacterium]
MMTLDAPRGAFPPTTTPLPTWRFLKAVALGLAVASQLALGAMLRPDTVRAAVPAPDERLGGHVTARIGERVVAFPTLKTDVKADVRGDIATVTVTQTFLNPANVPLNATYLFPLNRRAAVHHMRMQVADEIVTAVIQKKEEARRTFETAKRAGKAAALLEQHRPNMFTQEIANLMPGVPITITLTYSQAVPRVDGHYELVVPLVVGPRYRPAHHRAPPRVAGGAPAAPQPDAANVRRDDGGPIVPPAPVPAVPRFGGWQLGPIPKYPAVSGLTVPDTVERDRVAITVDLTSAIPMSGIGSATHRVTVTGEGDSRRIVLADGRTIDNRDFVLRYTLAGKAPQAGLLVHRDKRGGYFSLMIEPPAAPAADQIAAREIVFILDTSGSMGGLPIEASKTFMRHALKGLRPADRFRIVTFANQATEFSRQPVPATPENLAAGLAYVDGLRASGGTEVLHGLRLAYAAPLNKDALRLVVFLSDGYVSNEPEILRMVASHVGAGRMYTFGVGTSVNRYLIAEMARQGRGRHRIIDPTQKAHDEAMAFARSLESP